MYQYFVRDDLGSTVTNSDQRLMKVVGINSVLQGCNSLVESGFKNTCFCIIVILLTLLQMILARVIFLISFS